MNDRVIVGGADLAQAFQDLIAGTRSREEIADWANELRKASDAGCLEFVPPASRSSLWEAILYLTGVDLKISPQEYLHCNADFESARDRYGL